MDLIGQFDSPFVRRVALAMHHYGLAYVHRPLSVWADSEEIAKLNPLRRVPVLFVEGEALVDSAAILDAVDDMVNDDRRLIPRAGAHRRAIWRVCALAMGIADKAVSLLYERVLRTEERHSHVWVQRCSAQIRDTLGLLEAERAASRGPFWFGAMSHADLSVACTIRFVREAHPEQWPGWSLPALASDSQRCEETALFQSASQPLLVAVDRP